MAKIPDPKAFLKTHVVECIFPHIFEPTTRFNPEGTYKIDALLNPHASQNDANLIRFVREYLPENPDQLPYKKHLDQKTKTPDGMYTMSFSSDYATKVFDAKGQAIEESLPIGNGSKVVIGYTMKHYDPRTGKKGLKLYLQAVQIIDYVAYDGRSSEDFGFEPNDNGFDIVKERDAFSAITGTDDDFSVANRVKDKIQNPENPDFDEFAGPGPITDIPPAQEEVAPGVQGNQGNGAGCEDLAF